MFPASHGAHALSLPLPQATWGWAATFSGPLKLPVPTVPAEGDWCLHRKRDLNTEAGRHGKNLV